MCRCDENGELTRSGGPLWPGNPGHESGGLRVRVGRRKWRVVELM